MFMGDRVNTLSFKFKYFVDISSDYKYSYKSKDNIAQNAIVFPQPQNMPDISLGFGLDKKYFGYDISYNFNRKAVLFDFNFKF